MRLIQSVAAMAALATAVSASDVLDLTKAAFQKEVAGEGLTLVEL
jgi:hypothetical protein